KRAPDIKSTSTGIEFAEIPEGRFVMGGGSGDKPHNVTISHPFYLAKFEVTQEEFNQMMGFNPSWFTDKYEGTPHDVRGQISRRNSTGPEFASCKGMDTSRFPVGGVTWYDAIEFCNRISLHDGLTPYYRISNVKKNKAAITSATVEINKG